MTDKNEIAKLAAENSELRARLDAIEDKLAPKRPPVVLIDEGVRVTVSPMLPPATRQPRSNTKISCRSCSAHTLISCRASNRTVSDCKTGIAVNI